MIPWEIGSTIKAVSPSCFCISVKNGGNKVLITKVVGCILIILSSSLMGFYYGNELKNRVNDLKELKTYYTPSGRY